MEQMLNRMLWGQLHAAGFFGRGRDPRSLMEQSNALRAPHRRWMRESLDVLTRAGILVRTDGGYAAAEAAPPDVRELWAQWDRMSAGWLADPDLSAQARLAERTLRALPDILAGRVKATEILFPGGTMELVEGIYKHNRTADYYNGVLGDMVEAYMEEIAAERRTSGTAARLGIRILEVGAGTGGTSAEVFRRLRPYRDLVQEYCYTDMSKAFLAHAKRAYGSENPYLNCRIMNVELPYGEQGLECGAYDLVIAANVLHATVNIRRTLRNCKAALKQNGLLLLNEITSNTVFAHVTFGLLDGWWLYEDEAIRIPGSPCLGEAEWKRALEDEGFRSVLFAADGGKGQQIIVSESDGFIRRPAATSRPAEGSPSGDKQAAGQVAASDRNAAAGTPERSVDAEGSALQERPGATVASADFTRSRSAEVTPDEVRAYVRTAIREQLEQSLQLTDDMIDDDDAFSDYGLDSITGIQLVKGLNQALGCKLSITDIFDYSSVHQLAGHLVERYASDIRLPMPAESWGIEEAAAARESSLGDEANATESSLAARRAAAASDVRADQSQVTFNEATGTLTGTAQGQSMSDGCIDAEIPAETATKADASTDAREDVGTASTRVPAKGPIAVVGMSGRFAGAEDVHQLWATLAAGDDLVKEATRWDLRRAFPKREPFALHGGFLERIDEFDAAFFNIPGQEADYMDPQQRIFLEEAWKALEDAGYAGDAIEGRRCGVYVGCQNGEYHLLYGEDAPSQALWGMSPSLIPSRIAYVLDLQGPAIAVDTACSSSLVAIHLACQGLWAGETEMALAGGVSVRLTPDFHATGSNAGLLSERGRCFAFDDRADGFVLGEGAGAVVLKRLEDAIADGDHIYGVIRGSGMNQDGRTNGITAPSAKSQERLVRGVYEDFGIDPTTIQLVEAHGTGTQLGDAIEIEALSRVFRSSTSATGICAIGSLKSNTGHTATASGVAGLIKLLLSMQKRQMPPTLHFENGNANIDFGKSPFYVNTVLAPWEAPAGAKRRAALSAFGLNGTNAHLVVEEAPYRPSPIADGGSRLIALSARTPDQLRLQAERLAGYIRREQPAGLADISFTLLTGRKHLGHRLACAARTPGELLHRLEHWLAGGSGGDVHVFDGVVRGGAKDEASLRLGRDCLSRCVAMPDGEARDESLRTLARLYAEGCPLSYGELFRGGRYARVPLPVYPLAKDRHWLPEQESERGSARGAYAAEPVAQEPIAIIGTSGSQPFVADANERGFQPQVGEVNAAAWERFDPRIFGLTPEQAALAEPHHRLALMHGWKAVEAAGCAPGALAGSRTAVFVGMGRGAAVDSSRRLALTLSDELDADLPTLNVANWLSWLLDLRGPSDAIDTAGSSALSAIDRAVKAIRAGECETALVGGVDASAGVAQSVIGIQETAATSEGGSGSVQGGQEGVVMLLLKKLSAAERDGDPIVGVIRASVAGHGGRSQSYALPSATALSELLATAYDQIGIVPSAVAYAELDSTDFDSVGKKALQDLMGEAFGEIGRTTGDVGRQESQYGIRTTGYAGHAAGMASVMSVLQWLAHQQEADRTQTSQVSAAKSFDAERAFANRNEQDQAGPRLAGVTAIGRGGVFAHVVLEAYEPKPREPRASVITPDQPGVFLLSAMDEDALKIRAAEMLSAVSTLPEERIDDVAFTLQTGRDALDARLAVVAGSLRELSAMLDAFVSGKSRQEGVYCGQVSPDNEAVRLLAADDEDCNELVSRWLTKRKFDRLLPLWVHGLHVDWTGMYGSGDARPGRLSLPTYPFGAMRTCTAESAAAVHASAL
ncbi:beta-ketoacyl synthase N-terminal-like domain-containing protein [Paenibacillus methanolicus]|uniref:Ketoacyl-synthetase-like protein n=1 Tax=Paenibacillus methanolicus TaxID=582686 RepID=A0A5S5CIW3_9BACL|nr:beta-ketoacyl synthase N-terminal-like domain-containing protein [Paenibacillus methanolicus]TYP78146.1 ketoacyl-synthetase-like protein [Paenibacillus methanolicus]